MKLQVKILLIIISIAFFRAQKFELIQQISSELQNGYLVSRYRVVSTSTESSLPPHDFANSLGPFQISIKRVIETNSIIDIKFNISSKKKERFQNFPLPQGGSFKNRQNYVGFDYEEIPQNFAPNLKLYGFKMVEFKYLVEAERFYMNKIGASSKALVFSKAKTEITKAQGTIYNVDIKDITARTSQTYYYQTDEGKKMVQLIKGIRFVRLSQSNEYLQVAQIACTDLSGNYVTQNKPTSDSGVWQHNGPCYSSYAVNGDLSARVLGNNVYHSIDGISPYMEIDLQGDYDINGCVYYNRSDGPSRSIGMVLELKDRNHEVKSKMTVLGQDLKIYILPQPLYP